MHTTQNLDSFVYRGLFVYFESFNMETRNKAQLLLMMNHHSFKIQCFHYYSLTLQKKYCFLSLKD